MATDRATEEPSWWAWALYWLPKPWYLDVCFIACYYGDTVLDAIATPVKARPAAAPLLPL